MPKSNIKQAHKKYKYNVGDRLGPDNILLLKRLGRDEHYEYKGLF